MPLSEEFARSASWLFRWRSYLPFVLLPLILVAAMRYPVIESHPNLHFAWGLFSLCVSLIGLFVRCHAIGHAAEGTAGRNTKLQVAELLNTTGFYSVVRHPLYLGNFLIALGIVMHSFAPWLVVIYIMAFALYYERIMFAEEAFLRRKFGRDFMAWSTQTVTVHDPVNRQITAFLNSLENASSRNDVIPIRFLDNLLGKIRRGSWNTRISLLRSSRKARTSDP